MENNHPEFFNESRMQSRETLIGDGVQLHPYSYEYTKGIPEIIDNFDSLAGSVHKICGRVVSLRLMGKAAFLNVSQDHVSLQVYVRVNNVGEELFKVLTKEIGLGDIIGVEGELFITRTGEKTLNCTKGEILSKAVVDIPYGKSTGEESWYTLSDVEIKRTQRYLDWITDADSFTRFRKRFEITSWIREYMNSKGFLEVLTPTIEPIYGGAEARPFTTKINALSDATAYLRISPELYLKRYIVGGFEKVFTICQNFRNEGIDSTHNPEFTMMEWYEAYTDYEFQMERFEDIICHLVEKLTGGNSIEYKGRNIDFTRPWKRISLPERIAAVFGKHVTELSKEEVISKMREKGLCVEEDTNRLVNDYSVGELLMEYIEHDIEEELWGPCFVIDHPQDISPLTKEKRGMPGYVERFEPFIAGMEVGNAYSELTDPVEQLARFRAQQQAKQNSTRGYDDHPMDMDFIKAMGCGMPPTGGVGLGVDRIIMILLGAESIRDIIPFPMKKGV